MFDYTGFLVRSTAGRDKGALLCVVGMDPKGALLLADGKRRRVEKPKAKKLGHVAALTDGAGGYGHPVTQALRAGVMPSNRALRQMLAAFRDSEMAGGGLSAATQRSRR